METAKLIDIENDSLMDFFKRYCKAALNEDSPWGGFDHHLDIIPGSFEEGTLIYFHINERGSRTWKDIVTVLVYKVTKYDYMSDRLVRVDE